MASTEIVKRAIASGRVYDDLPSRIKNMITPYEWRSRVKEHCIQRGLPWATSLACTVVGQQEYYDDLLRSYKTWMRLFPYHLSDYLCRVARITPFKYYLDMMATVLKEERSYDRVPNFTAADALSVLGIGRNEYISALNACKARRLLWRVNLNRESIVREQLPQEPTTSPRLEPWWRVAVVNIGEAEYRELGEEELAHLKTAALPTHAAGGNIRVRDFQPDVLRGLLRKGLAYVEVPVDPADRFAIPPLEGFVSNKTAEAGDAASDPLEALLYSVFVANSDRMTVADLGSILGVDLEELKAAIGVASRLGFATRVTDAHPAASAQAGALSSDISASGGVAARPQGKGAGAGGQEAGAGGTAAMAADSDEASLQRQEQRSLQLAEGLLGTQNSGRGGGVAIVVDAEATGYLMMGALSPGLKRHSVTLFEGGRVAGEDVMRELVSELWASYAAGQAFEGEMLHLTHYAAALATLLEAVRASAGPGVPLELLRKESLAGLSPMSACKVLNHAYCAVVPISPLPPPVLPLSPHQPGPAYYGPTLEAVSPWLHLALYSAARCGPQSYVFVCGQRVWRLPHPLDRCTHALLTPWDEDTEPGRAARAHGTEGQMMLVEASFLLYTLNELLSRTAVLVQPLDCTEPDWFPDVVDVPLPLPQDVVSAAALARPGSADVATAAPAFVAGIRRTGGDAVKVALAPELVSGLQQLGLASCVGHLRLMRTRAPPPPAPATPPTRSPDAASGGVRSQPPQGEALHQSFTISAAAPLSRPALGSSSLAATPSGTGAAHGLEQQQQPTRYPSGGWDPPRATPLAGAGGPGGDASGGDGGGRWLPLSVQLGVPLYSLDLCKAVCRAAEAGGFLTQEGRQTQLQSHKQLQNQLTKLLVQYSHCAQDGSYGSCIGLTGGVGEASASADGAAPGGGGEAVAGSNAGSVGGGQPSGAGLGVGGRGSPVLPLPALNLSFDGHSLQPIRLRDSVQGLGCLCQA